MGLYLQPSPRNASFISLIPPKFRVQHDDFFETVQITSGNSLTLSHWHQLSGFKNDTPPHICHQERLGPEPFIPDQVQQEKLLVTENEDIQSSKGDAAPG